jgi:hypothetical protein
MEAAPLAALVRTFEYVNFHGIDTKRMQPVIDMLAGYPRSRLALLTCNNRPVDVPPAEYLSGDARGDPSASALRIAVEDTSPAVVA